MRSRFGILAFFFCFACIPAAYAAGKKVVIGEAFTGTW